MKTILSLFFVCVMVTASAQKVKLMLNLKAGETYRQIMTSNVEIVQDIQGQQMKILMSVRGAASYKVTTVENSIYSMDVVYDSLSMTMELPNGRVEFSSEKNDDTDIMSTLLASIKSKSFQVKMTSTGTVKEVKGIEALFETMFQSSPELPEAQRRQLLDQVMKAYGEEAFRGNLEMVTSIYTENPVAIGETWLITTQLKGGMTATLQTTYKLKEATADFFMISGEASLVTDKSVYVESNGMPIAYDLSGTMLSDIQVNRKSGWIKLAKLNQSIKGTANIKDTPQIPGGLAVPMSMNSEITIIE
jgi:hypothetical protein